MGNREKVNGRRAAEEEEKEEKEKEKEKEKELQQGENKWQK
ncbi:hypothetical protein [Methanosarcina siciliae]|nr:hypothetical protein [Methanosarcina siciliae]